MNLSLFFITLLIILLKADCSPANVSTRCPFKGYEKFVTFDNRTCYMTSPYYMKFTWHDAKEWCTLSASQMASIHNDHTNQLLTNWTRDYQYAGYKNWIGLNSLQQRGVYKWVDGTAKDYTDFDIIIDQNKNHYNVMFQGRCVYMDAKTARWVYDDCNNNQIGVLCEKDFTSAVRPTEVLPTVGNCPEDWFQYNDVKCIKIINKTLTSSQAKVACHSSNGELLTIHSRQELNFVLALISNWPSSYIGLRKKHFNEWGVGTWTWDDESKLMFDNWANDEPSGKNECAVILTDDTQAGQWMSVNCNSTHTAICEKPTDPSIKTPPAATFKYCSIDGFTDLEYVQYRNSCYKIIEFDAALNWNQAEEYCFGQNAHLVSVLDVYEHAFLIYYIQQFSKSDEFWTGLYADGLVGTENTTQVLFKWSDSWPVYYTYWDVNEPNVLWGNYTKCVYQDKFNGTWRTDECEARRAFICKATINKLPDLGTNDSGICPTYNSSMKEYSWIDVDKRSKYCYWFSNSLIYYGVEGWPDANFHCRRRWGTLVSIHSNHELSLLRRFTQKANHDFWIGLYKSPDGAYSWEDGSPFDFTNWYAGQPTLDDDSFCVQMRSADLRWGEVPCYENRYKRNFYICQIPKLYPNNGSLMSSQSNTGTFTLMLLSLTISSLLIISVLFGVCYYYYIKKPKFDPDYVPNIINSMYTNSTDPNDESKNL